MTSRNPAIHYAEQAEIAPDEETSSLALSGSSLWAVREHALVQEF